MMKYTKLATLLIIIAINVQLNAQTQVIPVWKTIIPGKTDNSDYDEKEVFKDGELQRTSQVVFPTLTIYKPSQVNGTAILICPGGGYGHLSMNKEGKKIAEWLNTLGITAIVLKYRLPSDLIMKDKSIRPLQDAQEAMKIIRRNAAEWKIDANKIGVMGFSAGGHLAATLSTRFDLPTYTPIDSISSRPDFSILLYPVISMTDEITHKVSRINLLGNTFTKETIHKFSNEYWVSRETPPTFIVHASDDVSVSAENSINYYLALKKNVIPAEMHIYENGGHGFGLGSDDQKKSWLSECTNWLKQRGLL